MTVILSIHQTSQPLIGAENIIVSGSVLLLCIQWQSINALHIFGCKNTNCSTYEESMVVVILAKDLGMLNPYQHV